MLPHEFEFEESLHRKVVEATGIPSQGFRSNYYAFSEEEIKRFKEQKEYVEQVKQRMFQEIMNNSRFFTTPGVYESKSNLLVDAISYIERTDHVFDPLLIKESKNE